MQAEERESIPLLLKALDHSTDHHRSRHTFAWDEERFLFTSRDTSDDGPSLFWSRKEAWSRSGRNSPLFRRCATPDSLWSDLLLFHFNSFLRQTPRRYWWGRQVHVDQTISAFPYELASYELLDDEEFAGERCHVVRSPERMEQLWVSKKTGDARGVLKFQIVETKPGFTSSQVVERITGRQFASRFEYANWMSVECTDALSEKIHVAFAKFNADAFPENCTLSELIRFSDYREIAPDVRLPFLEERSNAYPGKQGKRDYTKTTTKVLKASIDQSLVEPIAELMPKQGDQIEDRRFGPTVEYRFNDQSDDEIKILSKQLPDAADADQ